MVLTIGTHLNPITFISRRLLERTNDGQRLISTQKSHSKNYLRNALRIRVSHRRPIQTRPIPLQIRLYAPNTISRRHPRMLMYTHTEKRVQRLSKRVELSGRLRRAGCCSRVWARPNIRGTQCRRACARRQCAHLCRRAANRQ